MNEYQVLGPPGTGKTTYVSRQVANAAEKYGADRVFVASFTRAAAAELAGRDLPIPQDRIGTLHAHCYRALGSPEIAEGHIGEWNAWVPEAGFALSGGRVSLEDQADDGLDSGMTEGDEIARTVQVLRARQIPRDLWPISALAFDQRWQAWKEETGYLDYTDLIERCLARSEFAPGAPEVGFFDEVQDFTALELALVRHWASGMRYAVLAGDDDQCIYRFKGSSPDAFIVDGLDAEHRRVLDQSYRVPRAVHAAATTWIHQLSRREPKRYSPRDDTGRVVAPSVTLYDVDELVEQAEMAMSDGKTIMFLGSCSRHVDPLKAALRRDGIPFHNPYRRARGDWNPLGRRRGAVSSAERLLDFLCARDVLSNRSDRIWTADELRHWSDVVQADRVFVRGAKAQIKSWPNSDVLTRDRLADVFLPEALDVALRKDDRWFRDVLLETKRKPMEFALRVFDRGGISRLVAEPKVVIGTIHSVKGGEADVVAVFPDLSVPGYGEWMGSVEERDAIIRQFYVGMTRARETLVLCAPATRYAVDWMAA